MHVAGGGLAGYALRNGCRCAKRILRDIHVMSDALLCGAGRRVRLRRGERRKGYDRFRRPFRQIGGCAGGGLAGYALRNGCRCAGRILQAVRIMSTALPCGAGRCVRLRRGERRAGCDRFRRSLRQIGGCAGGGLAGYGLRAGSLFSECTQPRAIKIGGRAVRLCSALSGGIRRLGGTGGYLLRRCGAGRFTVGRSHVGHSPRSFSLSNNG